MCIGGEGGGGGGLHVYTVWFVSQSEPKWKQLGDLALSQCQFGLALECLHHAHDFSGLLLLATSAGDATTLEKIAEVTTAEGKNNIAFTSNFLLGR